jgi:hypothetical protein
MIRRMSSIAVVAFFALVVLPRATTPLVDGDIWWHLRAGETVLANATVPRVDTWTIVGQNHRWVSQDWLSNVVIALLYGLGPWGATLLSLAFAMVVTAAFILIWRSIGNRGAQTDWIWRLLLLTFGLIVAGPVIGVRVQSVDLLMSAATLAVLWRFLRDQRLAQLWWLPALATAWVNLHAGFPLLFLLIGAVVVGESVDRLLGRRLTSEPLRWQSIGGLALAAIGAVATLAANPNGLAIYAYPFQTAGIQAHRDFIFEWSRPDLSSLPGQLLFAFLLVVVVPTLFLARRRMRASDALTLIGLTILSLLAIRFVLVVGPIGAAIAAVYLPPHLESNKFGALIGTFATRMARYPRASPQGAINAFLVATVVAVGVGVSVARSSPEVQRNAIAAAMPVGASRWLEGHGPVRRIFNVYAWGGYLGRELPDALVYIDGRSDIYGDAPIRNYANLINLQIDPGPTLDAQRIDHIVFWPDSALASWLDASGRWRRVYTDSVAAVWTRRPSS